ncbi:MAG: radical SAM protein [Candidatus Hodarchaeales archaeon]
MTNRCNYRCNTCNIGKENSKNPKLTENELSLEEIENFFLKNKDLLNNLEFIQITGGEPFSRKDIVEIISAINKISPKCGIWIATNGSNPSLIAKKVEILCNFCGDLGISISLHGSKKTHDKFTGIKGSFEKAIQTMEKIVELREKNPHLKTSFGFTITPGNYKEMIQVYEIAEKYNSNFSVRPKNYSKIYFKSLTELDYKPFLKELNSILQKLGKKGGLTVYNPLELSRLYYISGIMDFIRNPVNRRLSCSAGSQSFFLDSIGNIYPCLMVDEKFGNIRSKSFKDIWNSSGAEVIRKKIREGYCPNCWVECQTYRNIYENPHLMIKFAIKQFIRRFTKNNAITDS